MDFAFVYVLVGLIWLAAKAAFVIAVGICIFVVWFVARDVWRTIKYKQQR